MIKSSELGSLPSLEMFYFVLVYVRQRSFFFVTDKTRRMSRCKETVMALYGQEAVA